MAIPLGIGGVMAIGSLAMTAVSCISSVFGSRKLKKQQAGMNAQLQAENAKTAAALSAQLGGTGNVAANYIAANGGSGAPAQGAAGRNPSWAQA